MRPRQACRRGAAAGDDSLAQGRASFRVVGHDSRPASRQWDPRDTAWQPPNRRTPAIRAMPSGVMSPPLPRLTGQLVFRVIDEPVARPTRVVVHWESQVSVDGA